MLNSARSDVASDPFCATRRTCSGGPRASLGGARAEPGRRLHPVRDRELSRSRCSGTTGRGAGLSSGGSALRVTGGTLPSSAQRTTTCLFHTFVFWWCGSAKGKTLISGNHRLDSRRLSSAPLFGWPGPGASSARRHETAAPGREMRLTAPQRAGTSPSHLSPSQSAAGWDKNPRDYLRLLAARHRRGTCKGLPDPATSPNWPPAPAGRSPGPDAQTGRRGKATNCRFPVPGRTVPARCQRRAVPIPGPHSRPLSRDYFRNAALPAASPGPRSCSEAARRALSISNNSGTCHAGLLPAFSLSFAAGAET